MLISKNLFTCELTMSIEVIDTRGTFENLDDGLLSGDFQYLPFSDWSILQADVDDLGVSKIIKK